jgi:AcrR family transcriptional regulator
MSKRAAAAEETRRRIVAATHELHNEQGIAATSWDDIAERAGVGVGTVYRHFPSLDELIPACGAVVAEVLRLPDASAVDGADELVAEVFGIYERGAAELRAIVREADVHPLLRREADAFERTLDALIGAAALPGDRRVARGLLDLATWDALRRQGLTAGEAVATVTRLLAGDGSPG